MAGKKRRGAGEGSVHYREKDGRWAGTFTVGVDSNGKRRRKTVYGRSQREAIEKLREAQQQARQGLLPERASDTTVSQFLNYWLESVVAAGSRPNTVRIYRQAVRRSLPVLGGRRLQSLRRSHIEALFRWLASTPRVDVAMRVIPSLDLGPEAQDRRIAKARSDKDATRPLSTATIRSVRGALDQALAQAARDGLLAFNPVRDAAMPKEVVGEAAEREYPSAESLRRFLSAIEGDRFEAFWLLAVHTGARHGELLGLTWQSIDFAGGSIQISGTWDEARRALGPTKSKTGKRTVYVGPEVLAALRRHRAGFAALPHPTQFIFANDETGRPVNPTTIRAHMKNILRQAGLPESTRVHDLRHGAATVLANSGQVPLTVARDQLGHSSVRMTEQYVHTDADAQRRAAATLADALRVRDSEG